jgi:two-component system response regulator DevR
MKSIFVVEKHNCFRESLSCVLDLEPDLEVIGQAGSFAQTHACIEDGRADVLLVGFELLDGDAVELIREIHEATPSIAVLVLSTASDPAWHARALQAGAGRVLTKNASLQELVAAVMILGYEPLAQSLALTP